MCDIYICMCVCRACVCAGYLNDTPHARLAWPESRGRVSSSGHGKWQRNASGNASRTFWPTKSNQLWSINNSISGISCRSDAIKAGATSSSDSPQPAMPSINCAARIAAGNCDEVPSWSWQANAGHQMLLLLQPISELILRLIGLI